MFDTRLKVKMLVNTVLNMWWVTFHPLGTMNILNTYYDTLLIKSDCLSCKKQEMLKEGQENHREHPEQM